MKKIFDYSKWFLFGFMCVVVGLYPVIYFLIDRNFGLLSTKSPELLSALFWNVGFYGHIVFGGIALLIGWTQFSKRLRRRRIGLHRLLGKVYIISALISGCCGVFIAFFATGGLSNSIGFALSGSVWLTTTFLAYKAIVKGRIQRHQHFMTYSYAVCFSAVTLRIWLPTFIALTDDFMTAYRIVGWLSWVPNLIVAYFILQRNDKTPIIKPG